MNPINDFLLTGAIIAVISFIKQYFSGVISGGVTIIVAALLGGIAGFLKFEGLDIVTGVIIGLTSVGVHTVATAVGTGIEPPVPPKQPPTSNPSGSQMGPNT